MTAPAAEVDRLGVEIPEQLPVVPLPFVVFPHAAVPLVIHNEPAIAAIDAAINSERMVAVVLEREADVRELSGEQLHTVGTAAMVLRMMKMPDGVMHLLVQGLVRVHIEEWVPADDHLRAGVVEQPDEDFEDSLELQALIHSTVNNFQRAVELSDDLPEEAYIAALNIEHPGKLADMIASNIELEAEQRQELLADTSPVSRLEKVSRLLAQRLQLLELSGRIESEARKEMDKAQREYYLRQKLREIQRELGEEDSAAIEVRELREKVEQCAMPEEARVIADRELARLERVPIQSPEHVVIRNYLDWLTELPWESPPAKPIDLKRSAAVLDADHYGLDDVKERVMEHLSVLALKPDMKGPILCFVGPPGVGKTSLGQSIARAMDRKFARMSLGGIRDEAEIRGHRRTYIGSMPGRIIKGLRDVGAADPVFMLDEIDKVGVDYRGDPTAALLEVLDPEQNHSFRDHYIEAPFDLSRTMFITTANMVDTIPAPLLDRMEVIRLPGYTQREKLEIAVRHLVPRNLEAHGLTPELVTFTRGALRRIITAYTFEAGVRNLNREIATICRKCARRIVEGETNRQQVRVADVKGLLGPERRPREAKQRRAQVGVATGLAWTAAGGTVLSVEVVSMPGRGQLTLTGQLGEVMKESAQTAFSHLHANAAQFGIEDSFFRKSDLHVHVPAGAVPKDGPSAGVCIATAMASLGSGRPVSKDVAMTGEITLTGRVLAVGGVKEKILAASQAGIRTIVLPADNEKDLVDIPEDVRAKLDIVLASRISHVVHRALEKRRRRTDG